MKNIKIAIKLQSVAPYAEDIIIENINQTIAGIFNECVKKAGETPFAAEWDIKMTGEYSGKGHPEQYRQGTVYDGTEEE